MRAALLILSLMVPLAPTAAAQEPPMLTVMGEGRVAMRPDLATIRLGVVSEARMAEQALADNSAQMSAVLAHLADEGIAEADIQTSGLRLVPRQEDHRNASSTPAVVGFVATNEVTVRVRDLDRLGAVLDAVVGQGANRFSGLSFGLADESAALAEARRRAVADARARAETYADAAGVRLGRLQTITDQSGGAGPMDMRFAASAMEAVPVAPGEVSISASVTISWALEP